MFDRKEYIKKYMKQWRKNNPGYGKEYHEKWEKNNSEHIKKYKKKWYEDNSEHIRKIRRQRYLRDREKILKQMRQYYKGKIHYVQDYKLSKGCQLCGYNKNPEFLGFHHPDNNKKFNVSKAVTRNKGLEKIRKEMDKCIILCVSCHRKLHCKLKKLDKIKKKVLK